MEERKQPINWLELKTVLLGLQSFLSSSCGGNVIKVFCDNSTAVVYVNNRGGGNRVPELHSFFLLLIAYCLTVPLKPFNVQTVALAGLVSAQRSQALTALTLKNISVSENGTRFCVSRL